MQRLILTLFTLVLCVSCGRAPRTLIDDSEWENMSDEKRLEYRKEDDKFWLDSNPNTLKYNIYCWALEDEIFNAPQNRQLQIDCDRSGLY